MAWAACDGCGARVEWIASRGAKLGGRPCPVCGHALRGLRRGEGWSHPVWDEGAAKCLVCGPRVVWPRGSMAVLVGKWSGVCRQHVRHPEAEQRISERLELEARLQGRPTAAVAEEITAALRAAREAVGA